MSCPNPAITDENRATLCTAETCCLELYAYVRYYPTKAGNAIYLAIFALLLIAQIFQGIRFKTWGFMAGMIGGLILEILGYGGRLWMRKDMFSDSPFLMYLVPATIGPAFITASIYICLARIVPVYGESFSWFKPRTYTIVFVFNDIVSLLLQAIGGAITSGAESGSSELDKGVNIMIAGLAYQVISIFGFMAAMGWFAFNVWNGRRNGKAFSNHFAYLRMLTKFKLFLVALPLATVLIFVRCVYRVAELHQGFDGDLANDEVTFMILEGPMIFIAVGLLTFCHPGLVYDGHWAEANFSLRGRKVPAGVEGVHLEGKHGSNRDRAPISKPEAATSDSSMA